MTANQDEHWMAQALTLARKGAWTTTPNPNVGCVIVKDGQLVGEGYHHAAGTPHAEVHALAAAGELAQGATAYVTLEPCSHFGRTPPCADALIKAGVARVVCAMTDPNPDVAGRGLDKLRAAGIDVTVGTLNTQAEQLNPGFLKRMRTGLPHITLKMASSLDGATALSNGDSQWITGPQARADVQKGRAASCAIVTGAGTVVADDPSLNVRLPGVQRQPTRLILDSHGRTPRTARITQNDGETVLVHGPGLSESIKAEFREHGFDLVELPLTEGKIDLPSFVQWCGNQGFNNLWVEAGAQLSGAFFNAGLIDELWLYQAPKLLGAGTMPVLALQLQNLSDAVPLAVADVRFVGKDLRWRLVPDFP